MTNDDELEDIAEQNKIAYNTGNIKVNIQTSRYKNFINEKKGPLWKRQLKRIEAAKHRRDKNITAQQNNFKK